MRYALLSFLCIITVIAYIQRSAFNGATKTIESDLAIDSSDIGLVMGGWYLAYAVFQIPSGWVADQIGSKRALLLFATSWSILTGLVGLALGLPGLLLIWGFMGAAQAGIFPCCTKAIGATFPRTQQAFASGMLACCMSLGAALAPAITAEMLGPLSWQQIFALYAIPGVVWAWAFALLVPSPEGSTTQAEPKGGDHDDWHALPTPNAAESAAKPVQWSKLVTDPQMLILCLQQFLRAGPMVLFFTWFARVLQETRGLSESTAGGLASWPPLVGAFGGVLGGIISDWLLKRTENARLARQGMTFAALVIGATVSLAAFFVSDPFIAVSLMSVGAFCGMAGGVSGYSIAISYGGKRVATVFAMMNMSGNIGAALFPIVVGKIVKLTGNWNYALLLFAAMFAAGAVCWAVLNPKGTLFAEGEEQK
jgi:sugar phosphate permease